MAIHTRCRADARRRVDPGRGSGGGIRQNRPRPPSRAARTFPARDMIAGLAEGGRVRGGQRIRADRGGNSPGRCDFTVPSECRASRAGGGGRGPLPGLRRPGPGTRARFPGRWSYADDMVVCCHTRQQAEQVKAQLAGWLAPRGLSFNEDKTKIVHLSEGFDFLGFNVRRYPDGKLLIKPSKAAIRRLRQRLAAEMRTLRGAQRGGGPRARSTRSCGDGRPTTGAWCRAGRSRPLGPLPVEAHLQVGQLQPPEQAEAAGSSAGTTASSARPGTTAGCSATATTAPTC